MHGHRGVVLVDIRRLPAVVVLVAVVVVAEVGEERLEGVLLFLLLFQLLLILEISYIEDLTSNVIYTYLYIQGYISGQRRTFVDLKL